MLYKWVVQNKLTKYFTTRGKLVGDLSLQVDELAPFFVADEKGKQALHVAQEGLMRQVRYLKAQRVPLAYTDYQVEVMPTWYKESGETVEIACILKETMQYGVLKEPTQIWSRHVICCKLGGGCGIYSHGRIDASEEVVENTRRKGSRSDKIIVIPPTSFSEKEKLRRLRDQYIAQMEGTAAYDWEKAVAYANTYALKPNIPKWANYEKLGGDCTNFTSQCLHAGGIPFDTKNPDPSLCWYWYGEEKRTPSWSGAAAFRYYLMQPRNHGVITRVIPEMELLLGDIVQLGDENKVTHSMIVVDYIYDVGDTNKIMDVVVAQHSTDLQGRGKNIPLSSKIGARICYGVAGYIVPK